MKSREGGIYRNSSSFHVKCFPKNNDTIWKIVFLYAKIVSVKFEICDLKECLICFQNIR